LNFRQALSGDAEHHGDRLELGDDNQRRLVVRQRGSRRSQRMDNVADVEQSETDYAVERGDKRGIAELSLGVLNCRLIALDLRDKLGDRGLLVGDLLERDRILFGEGRKARQVLSAFFMCVSSWARVASA
jgi:hypothetical protein